MNPDYENSIFIRNYEDYDRYGCITQTMSYCELYPEEAYADKALYLDYVERMKAKSRPSSSRSRSYYEEYYRQPSKPKSVNDILADIAKEGGFVELKVPKYLLLPGHKLDHKIYKIRPYSDDQ